MHRKKSLKQVQVLFSQWRQSCRKGRGRIPEQLWEAAVEVARSEPISMVAKALRLDYVQLKRRMGKRHRGRKNHFIEVPPSGAPLQPTPTGVEIINPNGFRMRLNASPGQDFISILRCFMGGER